MLAVTAVPCECSTLTGWARTPPTSFSRWSWSIPSTRPSDATQTPSGSQERCTSTERCVAWHRRVRRAAAWVRATSSTWPLEAPAMQPGRGATPCSCTATVRACQPCLYIYKNKQLFLWGWSVSFHCVCRTWARSLLMLFQRVITTSPRARPVKVKTFTLYWIRNKVILK